jgi:hypothetical protein
MNAPPSPENTESAHGAHAAGAGGDPVRGRRVSLAFCIAFALTLAAALAVNALGNGDDVFPFELRPSQSLRAWKARRLKALVDAGTPPEVLILGSSRAMQINPKHIQALVGLPAFNFAVFSGNALDCHVELRYAIRIGACPRIVIVNIDESFLGYAIDRPQLQVAGHSGLLQALSRRQMLKVARRIVGGINLESTAKSLGALLAAPVAEDEVLVLRRDGRTKIVLDDGYYLKPRELRERERGLFDLPAIIEQDASRAAKKPARGKNAPSDQEPRFDPSARAELAALFDLAESNGCQVYVITTPEHPALAERGAGRDSRRLEKLRTLLTEDCARRGFVYRDFSNLESFGGTAEEFWDSTHQTATNVERMMNVLFEAPAAPDGPAVATDLELLDALETTRHTVFE